MSEAEDFQFYLDEACYYLKKLGLNFKEIAEKLEEQQVEVEKRFHRYQSKIGRGEIQESRVDRTYWEDILHEARGDVKVTYARSDGFYHCRKSDLEKIDSATLMQIFDSSKQFLQFEPSYHYGFLDGKPPVGYDPLALSREIKKTIEIIEKILDMRKG